MRSLAAVLLCLLMLISGIGQRVSAAAFADALSNTVSDADIVSMDPRGRLATPSDYINQDEYLYTGGITEYLYPEDTEGEVLQEPESEGLSGSEGEMLPVEELLPLKGTAQKKMQKKKALQSGLAGLKATAAPVQEPVTGNGATIEKLTVRWVSHSTGASEPARFDCLELSPETDLLPNMQFQIDFALSGKQNHEAGAVELTFPACILRDREGNEAGELTLSLPEESEGRGDFVWKRVGDEIVVTNARRISAASKVMFQGTFRYTVSGESLTAAHEVRDVDTVDQSLPYRGQTDILQAMLKLKTAGGQELVMESNEIQATVDTFARADTVSAKGTAWWNAEEAPVPQEFLTEAALQQAGLDGSIDDYALVRWYVSGSMTGSQPALMELEYRLTDTCGGRMIGVEMDGGSLPAAGQSTVIRLFDGYRENIKSALVWAVYPKAILTAAEGKCELTGEARLMVTGWDDELLSVKTAAAEVSLRTPVIYSFEKKWLDNDNAVGVRPDRMWLKIYRTDPETESRELWRKVEITPDKDGKWLYSWSDQGRGDIYDVAEELVNASGTFDPVYDAAGRMRQVKWGYILYDSSYDEKLHRWTFGNKYTAGWIALPVTWFAKQALDHTDYRRRSRQDRDLSRLLAGEEAEVSFRLHGAAAPAVWTLAGQKPVQFTLTDEQYTFGGESLSAEDAEIVWVEPQPAVEYAYTNYDEETAAYERVRTDTPPVMYLEGRRNGSWIRFASIETVPEDNVLIHPEQGTRVDNGRILLPREVTAIRLTGETDEAIVELDCRMGMRLKPSPAVQALIQQELEENTIGMLRLENTARLELTHEGTMLTEKAGTASAYLHGRLSKVAARLTKDFTLEENDLSAKTLRLKVHSQLILQSTLEDAEEYHTAIKEGILPATEGGTFYDLLPPGVEPDLSTLRVDGEGSIRSAYTIENYRGSGRTLAVIEAALPEQLQMMTVDTESRYGQDPDYPAAGLCDTKGISFDCRFSYEEAVETDLAAMHNVIAFEAEGSRIGNVSGYCGEADDASGNAHKETLRMLQNDAALMENLDPGRDDPAFVYAGAYLAADELDLAAQMELRKYVMVGGDGDWVSGLGNERAIVSEGGNYAYRLSFQAATDCSARDIILLDALENYIPGEWDEDCGDRQWRGRLAGMNISDLIKEGIAPKVYITRTPDIDISGLNPSHEKEVVQKYLEESPEWEEWNPDLASESDLSDVTAVAIDCTLGTDGRAFELAAGRLLSVYLYMKAPEGEQALPAFAEEGYDDPDRNAHAYNQVYLDSTEINVRGETHAYVHYDYTKVGIAAWNFSVRKIWEDDEDRDGLRPEEVTVRLFEGDQDTGRFVRLSKEMPSGVFSHVRRFDEEGREIAWRFVEDPVPGYTPAVKREGEQISIVNTHVPEETRISVDKEWADDVLENGSLARPASVKVHLYADGVFTGRSQILRADAEGRWQTAFTGLPRYRDQGQQIVYSVQEEPVEDFITEMTAETGPEGQLQVHLTNRYYPYGDLKVVKLLEQATEAAKAQEFRFTLLLKDENGEETAEKYAYERYAANADGTLQKTAAGRIGSGDDFLLKGGESLIIKDLPSRMQYEVAEIRRPGFTLTKAENTGGYIRAGRENTAVFTNTYKSRGEVTLRAHKTLSGRTLGKNQFYFRLKEMRETAGTDPAAEENPESETASVTQRLNANQADGSISFGALRFTEQDDGRTFVYRISEVNSQAAGYSYDSRIFTARVTPRDLGNGKMTAEIQYLDPEGKIVDQPAFANTYHAEGTHSFRAWKVLAGRELAEGEFTFALYGENGELLEMAVNTADGNIIFPALHFDEQDAGKEYEYSIREMKGEDESVIYDRSVFRYRLKVMDRGNGELYFEETLPDDQMPVFENGLKNGGLSVSKYVEDSADGTSVPDQEFKFHLRLLGEVPAEEITWTTGRAPDKTLLQENAASPAAAETDSRHTAAPFSSAKTLEGSPTTTDSVLNTGLKATLQAAPKAAPKATPAAVDLSAYPAADAAITSSDTKDSCTYELYSDGTLVLRPTSGSTGILNGVPGWSGIKEEVLRVKCTGTILFQGTSMESMFSGFSNVTVISLAGMNTSAVENMSWMFHACRNLVQVDVSSFDTSRVRTFRYMFNNCHSLTDVDTSGFRTPAAENFYGMFNQCRVLPYVDVSHFDTSRAWEFTYMFHQCWNLADLDVSGFDMSNAGSLYSMFTQCGSLKELDVSGWNPEKATNFYGMFSSCNNLEYLDLSNWNTGKAKVMQYMFAQCGSMKKIDLGPDFAFDGGEISEEWNQAVLYTPNAYSGGIEYTGKWIREDRAFGPFTPEELRDSYQPAMAGTWIWEEAPSSYTVVYEPGGADVGGAMAASVFPSKSSASLPRNAFYRYGSRFVRWVDTANAAYRYGDCGTIPAKRYAPETVVHLQAVFEDRNKEISFEDGEAEFVLKAGEQITFANIPAGTAFQVYEVTAAGWVLTEQQGNAGWIQPLAKAEAFFTNRFVPESAQITLSGTKLMDGLPAASGVYQFELCREGTLLETVSNQEAGLISFTPITYNTAGKYIYTVREHSQGEEGIAYDSHEEEICVWVEETEGGLSAFAEYDEDGMLFQNYLKPGTLEIRKAAEGSIPAAANDEFTFKITLYHENGTLMEDGSYSWYYREDPALIRGLKVLGTKLQKTVTDLQKGAVSLLQADTTESAQETSGELKHGAMFVKLRAGRTAVIPNLPAGTRYLVEETDLPAGWTQVKADHTSGTIGAGLISTASFTNRYAARGTARIEAHKILEGETLKGGEFRFGLYEDKRLIDTAENGPEDENAEAPGDGEENVPNPWYQTAPVVFGDLEYTAAGTYHYIIREEAGEDSRISYDLHEEKVRVEVTDAGGGILSTEVIYEPDGALFENKMKTGSLIVEKAVQKASQAAWNQAFDFRIRLYDRFGKELKGTYEGSIVEPEDLLSAEPEDIPSTETIPSAGDSRTVRIRNGSIFQLCRGEQIQIDGLPHGCIYEVEELPCEGWTCTAATGTTGTITAGETAPAARFENTYNAAGQLTLTGRKILQGSRIPDDHSFCFRLTDEKGEVLGKAWADENGVFMFHLDYTLEEDGKTYLYYVREEDPGESYLSDTHEEEVRVSVRDNGQGRLLAEAETDADGLVFTNIACRDLIVRKILISSEYYDIERGNEEDISGEPGVPAKGSTKNADIFDFQLRLDIPPDTPAASAVPITVQQGEQITEQQPVDGILHFQLQAGEEIIFRNIPSTCTCTVEELTRGYDTELIRQTVDERTEILTFINRRNTITVHKTFLNQYAPFGTGTAIVQLEGTAADGSRISRTGILKEPEGVLRFDVPDGTYEIWEADTARYYVKSIEAITDNVTVHTDAAENEAEPGDETDRISGKETGYATVVLTGKDAELIIQNDFTQYEKLSHNDSAVNHIG